MDAWRYEKLQIESKRLSCLHVTGTVKLLSGSIASGSRPARPHARKYSGEKVTIKKASVKLAKKQRYNPEEKPDIKHLV